MARRWRQLAPARGVAQERCGSPAAVPPATAPLAQAKRTSAARCCYQGHWAAESAGWGGAPGDCRATAWPARATVRWTQPRRGSGGPRGCCPPACPSPPQSTPSQKRSIQLIRRLRLENLNSLRKGGLQVSGEASVAILTTQCDSRMRKTRIQLNCCEGYETVLPQLPRKKIKGNNE